jgi:hypothetical protein
MRANENSNIGDLARDVDIDGFIPTGPETLAVYENHLREMHACRDALDALRLAWILYKNSNVRILA